MASLAPPTCALSNGFLMVRTLAGETIAYSELVQKPTRGLMTSRFLLHFTDGSLYDETVTCSQHARKT